MVCADDKKTIKGMIALYKADLAATIDDGI